MREFSGDDCGRPSLEGKRGDLNVNNDAFELDLKINEGYQAYSAAPLPFWRITKVHQEMIWLFPYS
jgi:hypothetical protein